MSNMNNFSIKTRTMIGDTKEIISLTLILRVTHRKEKRVTRSMEGPFRGNFITEDLKVVLFRELISSLLIGKSQINH